MKHLGPIERTLLNSRRVMAAALFLAVFVLAVIVGSATLQTRERIRDQIAGRDALVLHRLITVLSRQEEALKSGDAQTSRLKGASAFISEDQLSIVLESALELKVALGVRVFDPAGGFVDGFPTELTEASLSAEDISALRTGRQVNRYHPAAQMFDYFYFAKPELKPLLEILIPIHPPGGRVVGFAQFLLDGESIAKEYARLDKNLALQATVSFLAGGGALGIALGWAFLRLRKAHELVAKRSEDLLRANRELALAAKTSALGAITGHLIHGLKNPLAGLSNYVGAQAAAVDQDPESDWHEAVAAARRMQALINETSNVLREHHADESYEVTLEELAGGVRSRVDPIAQKSGVKLDITVQQEANLPNRTANLVALILVNLAENAVQASRSGQTVKVVFGLVAGKFQFGVADQGPGIPSSTPLFVPCRSTKEGGTGLGLAICKQLANHLEADLELALNGPNGCTFKLSVPAPAANPVNT